MVRSHSDFDRLAAHAAAAIDTRNSHTCHVVLATTHTLEGELYVEQICHDLEAIGTDGHRARHMLVYGQGCEKTAFGVADGARRVQPQSHSTSLLPRTCSSNPRRGMDKPEVIASCAGKWGKKK